MPKKKRVQERRNCVSCGSKQTCIFRIEHKQQAVEHLKMFSHDLKTAVLRSNTMHMFDNYISRKCRFFNRKQ